MTTGGRTADGRGRRFVGKIGKTAPPPPPPPNRLTRLPTSFHAEADADADTTVDRVEVVFPTVAESRQERAESAIYGGEHI